MREIAVSIDEEGNITVDARGYVGKTCEQDIEKILASLREMGLEAKTVKRNLKPEYHARTQERQQVRI